MIVWLMVCLFDSDVMFDMIVQKMIGVMVIFISVMNVLLSGLSIVFVVGYMWLMFMLSIIVSRICMYSDLSSWVCFMMWLFFVFVLVLLC